MEDNNIFEKEPQWGEDGAPISEIRKIQRTIRRRSWKNISISVILAAILLTVSVFGIIPWAESLYWNPDEAAYRDCTDLEVTLNAYTELFAPGYNSILVTHHRTGFASYELQICLASNAQDEVLTARGSLERNVLHLDDFLVSPEGKNYPISRRILPDVPPTPSETEALRVQLRSLPDYVRLEAAVTFSEDLSMEELVTFWENAMQHSMDITWVAVRSVESTFEPLERIRLNKWIPQCGMDPFTGGKVYPGVDLDYRYYNKPDSFEPEQLEQHFISLLQYSADQLEKGRGIAHYGDEELYAEILDYVEENGVKTYGVVVTATPKTLLELLDRDSIYDIRLTDCWIDIG